MKRRTFLASLAALPAALLATRSSGSLPGLYDGSIRIAGPANMWVAPAGRCNGKTHRCCQHRRLRDLSDCESFDAWLEDVENLPELCARCRRREAELFNQMAEAHQRELKGMRDEVLWGLA